MRGINQPTMEKISKHLSYEIEMFELSARKLHSGNLNQLENNAYLECFILHGRNIIEFLYGTRKYKDDVLALDYFEDQGGFC